MQAPFYGKIGHLAESEIRARFFMPGHKGNPEALPRFGGALPYDITEIPGADNLQSPADTLAQSQRNMAALYGAGATLFAAGGSTACIQAMLTLFVPAGGAVVAARDCHIAAVHGFAFLDAQPTWVAPQAEHTDPDAVAAALRKSGAGAVYVTSPDYRGHIADLTALASVCHAAGAVLLVDNAHGAHLPFVWPQGHPLSCGADACAESAHKTLPCLTGAAMLHLEDAALARPARLALNRYSSTSPNYLILQSLDYAAGWLAAGRASDQRPFVDAAKALQKAGAAAAHFVHPVGDPLKLCLRPPQGGWQTEVVTAALLDAGIYAEAVLGDDIVLMASPFNTPEEFALLEQVLGVFEPRLLLDGFTDAGGCVVSQPDPIVRCSIRQAVFAPACRMRLRDAVGRVAAQVAAPCPPGIPLLMPGEELTPALAAVLEAGGISELDVVE